MVSRVTRAELCVTERAPNLSEPKLPLVTGSQSHCPPQGMDKARVSVHSWYEWSPVMIIPNPQGSDLVTQMVKNLLAMQETQVQPLGREDPLEKGMATHSTILAWRTPWIEESGGLQFMGLQRIRHN